MDQQHSTDSVYTLLTELCESFQLGPQKLKQFRAHSYELLLSKIRIKNPRKFPDVPGVTNPMLNLLAWCFTLRKDYELTDKAQELESAAELLKTSYSNDTQSFNNILTFLLCLRDIPKNTSNILDLSTLPDIEDEMSKYNNMFKLPSIEEYCQSTEMFKMLDNPLVAPTSQTPSKSVLDGEELWKDEGYSSPNKENIWEVAMHLNLSKRLTWESYDCGPPEKEKPFLSELGELSSLWVENLPSLYKTNSLCPSYTVVNNKIKPGKDFVKDLKFLLVGMPSETFNLSMIEEFFISPGMMMEGITPDILERFCHSFLFAGTCYRALSNMATPDINTRKFKYPGYVFAGFCESLARYLQFYRTAVFTIPDETNFLTFHQTTSNIQMQVATLASICKVGPYASKAECIPHGIELLNYLYSKVLGLSDRNLCMVLYAFLYPCCQIYFSRFLQQWLVQGVLNDPYGEFFIIPNLKYLTSRGRTYWSRSFTIRTDIIPDFLVDLKDDILLCGKIINLLKVCSPNNKLCLYLMDKEPLTLTCCLTNEALVDLEHSSTMYYLKASEKCGSKFVFQRDIEKSREENVQYLQLIARKRAATLRRIELERQKVVEEQQQKRLAELLVLKEQYEEAMQEKQLKVYRDIEKEIRVLEDDFRIEQMREKLIEDEAKKMIDYYSELSHLAEVRKEKIVNSIKSAAHIQIDTALPIVDEQHKSNEDLRQDKVNSSSESFYSAPDYQSNLPSEDEREDTKNAETPTLRNSESLDRLNGNFDTNPTTQVETSPTTTQQALDTIQQAVANFEFARRVKQKVLNQELGITTTADLFQKHLKPRENITSDLTAAQRNKLKVLSTEFGINAIHTEIQKEGVLTVAQINKNKVMGHHSCFDGYETTLDNANYVNRNVKPASVDSTSESSIKKSKSLQLNLKPEPDKVVPMSVDSTPMSDLPLLATPMSATPSSMMTSIETKTVNDDDNIQLQDIFSFTGTSKSSVASSFYQKTQESTPVPNFSKRVPIEEAKRISKNSLKTFLHESVSIPVLTHLKLANNEVLKYFVEDMGFLKHLNSLRDYFFLQDGEFGRNITDNLFDKLYSANFPLELINFRTLHHLVFDALDNSSKLQGENCKHLSFKINSLPKCFDLGDPDVLDCLSLTYKVHWPVNVLLPSETVSKYDQVFKFVIKLNRVSWVLKRMFWELKILAKETGEKEIYLMASPQYRRLHQYRHVMSHFVQTLQNYIVGDVLQPSWALFEKSLLQVSSLDQLYYAHIDYIKDIIFRCMLNQKSVALRNIIHKIFVVILKFYDYMRSRRWTCVEGSYVHPNFGKLEKIFKNFEEFVVYFFKVVKKVAKSGYQPGMVQFLDVLDVNSYYSGKLVVPA